MDIDTYQEYFAEELGYQFPYLSPEPSSKQRAVIAAQWAEDYELLMPYNIRPVTYTYEKGPRAGQEETRWVIKGEPGLWSYESMRRLWEKITGE